MLPSASLGAEDASGRRAALYEPVHGTAPDIAGKNKANPLATLLSFAMMLRYSFDLADDADLIERAVQDVLASGKRTGDIARPGQATVSTSQMGDAPLAALDKRAGRSDERRVGKVCDRPSSCRWSPLNEKQKNLNLTHYQ